MMPADPDAMRILVTGGRAYADQTRLDEALDSIHAARPITSLMHGGASGADRLAGDWAKRRSIPTDRQSAQWDNLDAPGAVIRRSPKTGKFYNKAAGLQRNLTMLDSRPDLVVAFPGGTGTAHCVANALRRGIAVMSVDP